MVSNLVMAEVSTSWQRWLSLAAFGLGVLALAACSQEPTLPPVLSNAERPTAVEISTAPEVGFCVLNAQATDYLDRLVRVHATLLSGFELDALVDPKCRDTLRPLLNVHFDESRMKRLTSPATLRSFDQRPRGNGLDAWNPSKEAASRFDVVLVGRLEATPTARWFTVFSVESVTPLEGAR